MYTKVIIIDILQQHLGVKIYHIKKNWNHLYMS